MDKRGFCQGRRLFGRDRKSKSTGAPGHAAGLLTEKRPVFYRWTLFKSFARWPAKEKARPRNPIPQSSVIWHFVHAVFRRTLKENLNEALILGFV